MAPSCAQLLLAAAASGCAVAHPLSLISLDWFNPGDPLGAQQSKFLEPEYLKAVGFTANVATGSNSPALVVDYPSLGLDFWPAGSAARLWREAQLVHLRGWVDDCTAAGISPLFWLDMNVLPTALVRALGDNVTSPYGPKSKARYVDFQKSMTRALLEEMFSEMFRLVPEAAGVIIRTGEIYTFDTPFHMGNAPVKVAHNASDRQSQWVDYLSFLRDQAEKHDKYVLFRTWLTFGDKNQYLQITNEVEPHPKFWISVKQQQGDYFRYLYWNALIGIGKHPQVVEFSAQRAYEGKGSYPNYLGDQVIHGYQEIDIAHRIGLERYVHLNTTVQGIWVWSRGDGWWGPYLKGHEIWPALHAQTWGRYWLSRGSITE